MYSRTSTKKTPVGQPSSSPTEAASANTAGFQKEWHCRGPAVTEQAILLVTGTRIWKQTGGHYITLHKIYDVSGIALNNVLVYTGCLPIKEEYYFVDLYYYGRPA